MVGAKEWEGHRYTSFAREDENSLLLGGGKPTMNLLVQSPNWWLRPIISGAPSHEVFHTLTVDCTPLCITVVENNCRTSRIITVRWTRFETAGGEKMHSTEGAPQRNFESAGQWIQKPTTRVKENEWATWCRQPRILYNTWYYLGHEHIHRGA